MSDSSSSGVASSASTSARRKRNRSSDKENNHVAKSSVGNEFPKYKDSKFAELISSGTYSGVSKYALTDYKLVLDDSFCDILCSDFGVCRTHFITDIYIALLFAAVGCCGATVYFSLFASLSWTASMPYITYATIAFAVFSVLILFHAIFVQQSIIFTGKINNTLNGSSATLNIDSSAQTDANAHYKVTMSLNSGNRCATIVRAIDVGRYFTETSGKLSGPAWYATVSEWIGALKDQLKSD